jgi:Insertion element 4 transposase N-terminal/Transposase DDE domain
MPAPTSSRIGPASLFQDLLPLELPEVVELLPVPGLRFISTRPRRPEFFFGVISAFCPPTLVDDVLDQCGRQGERSRRLPARLSVYTLLLMCLLPQLGYQRVLHRLAEATRGGWQVPNKSSFSRARQRLGEAPMQRLFHALAGPLATRGTAGCFWRGRRVVAIDGSTVALAPTPALEIFGGVRRDGIRIGPPLARLVSLVECGTRALLEARLAPYSATEAELAASLPGAIRPGMLVLADRGFLGVDLWRAFVETGADVLWRANEMVGKNRHRRRLEDGSYLTTITKNHRSETITVRIIEYRLAGSPEAYRLATNLLNPNLAPAAELARLYAERWEIELSFRDLKAVQCDKRSLRSLSEEGVRQEFWAHCVLYQISRRMAFQAAMSTPERDCDRISFTGVQDGLRRTLRTVTRSAAGALQQVIVAVTAERELLSRRDRCCPRLRRYHRAAFKPRATYQGDLSVRRPRRPDIVICA